MAQALPIKSISEESRRRKITFEEFLAWDGENQHVEWVQGRVIQLSPVSDRHGAIVSFLVQLLGVAAEEAGLGIVRTEPVTIRLAAAGTARTPDVLLLRNEHLGQIDNMFIDSPVDIVVEVVSPSSVRIDEIEKRAEYELCGIPEYWIVDPLTNTTLFLILNAAGRYEEAGLDGDGRYPCRALGNLPVDPRWFNQGSLPRVAPILKEWGLL